MERLSDTAIDIINELHTERLDYNREYIPLIDAAQRLAHYEDLEEQGWLVVLPCKVGDIVYDICDGTAYATRVLQFVMFQDGHLACRTVSSFPDVDQFGTRIFLNEADAEAALAQANEKEETH